jgi:hypothetical protein
MVAPNPTPGTKSLYLQDPQVRQIHLPEDRDCIQADSQGHCHCTVWTGGDLLAGTIEVSAPECADFAVDVRLEGKRLQPMSNSRTPMLTVAQEFVERGKEIGSLMMEAR